MCACVCDGLSCPAPGSWECHVSLEYIVLPDMSDSDGHCGPGFQSFLTLLNSLGCGSPPFDKSRRCRVS